MIERNIVDPQIINWIFNNSLLLSTRQVPIKKFLKLQYGGGKSLRISYDNNEYVFEKIEINGEYYALYTMNDDECVSVIINKKEGIAEIHSISNHSTCIKTNTLNIGSTILKLTIKMFKKYKEYLDIKKIVLTDNSIKQCCKNSIILSKMLILLNGDTWYGKYGFRPYNNQTNQIDERLSNKYNKNKDIIIKITIKDANILKYINLTNKKSIIEDVEELVKLHPDYLLKDFIKSFLHEYDKTCKYFVLFYEQLFEDIGLFDFHQRYFGLEL
jgi:hypothetical protein